MPLTTGNFTLDPATLPAGADRLGVSVTTTTVNKSKIAIVYPSTGREKSFARYVCGMTLAIAGGTTSGPQGQLVVTSQRIIGMINQQPPAGRALNDPWQPLVLFSFDHSDATPVQAVTNWRGKTVEATIDAVPAHQPSFRLHIVTVTVLLKNDGAVAGSTVQNLLDRLGPAGIRELRERD